MSKLYFRYGSMSSGKSLDILKVAYNYEEREQHVLLLSPSIDDRDGVNIIKSRTGLEREATVFRPSDNLFNLVQLLESDQEINCVLVDEAQFLTHFQVCQLSDVVDHLDIPVVCYGLRSDFRLEPFEGSKYLMAIADSIEEIKTVCWCGEKATVNARIQNGEVLLEGEQVLIGGNESYIPLCRKHYKEGKITR